MPLAAKSCICEFSELALFCLDKSILNDRGSTETSAPVSIKKDCREHWSETNKRLIKFGLLSMGRLESFIVDDTPEFD